jgi:hypothetical protein
MTYHPRKNTLRSQFAQIEKIQISHPAKSMLRIPFAQMLKMRAYPQKGWQRSPLVGTVRTWAIATRSRLRNLVAEMGKMI